MPHGRTFVFAVCPWCAQPITDEREIDFYVYGNVAIAGHLTCVWLARLFNLFVEDAEYVARRRTQ